MKKNIVFRVDGNHQIGMGHLYNMLSLADFLQGYNIIFITKDNPEAINKIKSKGHFTIPIPLSITFQEQVNLILQQVKKLKPTVYVTDIQVIEKDYADKLRQIGIKTISIDTLSTTKIKPDVFINRTTLKERQENYDYTAGTTFYLGSKYVIMDSQFTEIDEKVISDSIGRIVVTFGGSDPQNMTTKVLRALDNFDGIHTTAIIGPAYKNREELEQTLKSLKNKPTIIFNEENMKERLMKADIAISAAGKTCYELAVTGTPCLLYSCEPEQMLNINEFVNFGFVINMGWSNDFDKDKLLNQILHIDDKEKREKMSQSGRKFVDGKGVLRIVDIIRNSIKR